MGVLKFVLLFNLISCAKTNYLVEQSIGQMRLLNSGVDNQKVLTDPMVSKEHKEKIKKIEKYKKYFYQFYQKKPTEIYSKTVFLKAKAVTYLVVASPMDKIEAKKECFPVMGCFPYLGFFSKESANQHVQKLKQQGLATYMRPVYAYSTLGYFSDNILSSFFYYDDFELAELVFHELFHTIFFVKDDVDLNENLANYFGKQMAYQYFHWDQQKIKEREMKAQKIAKLRARVVNLVGELQQQYREDKETQPQKILERFIKERFMPEVESTCEELKLEPVNCFAVRRQWNNASFAAYLTYEKNVHFFKNLHRQLGLDLKQYYSFLESNYEQYSKLGDEKSFKEYLDKR